MRPVRRIRTGGIAALVLALCGAPARSAVAVAAPPDSSRATHVVMLGTGTPNADPERSGPAVAVVAGKELGSTTLTLLVPEPPYRP